MDSLFDDARNKVKDYLFRRPNASRRTSLWKIAIGGLGDLLRACFLPDRTFVHHPCGVFPRTHTRCRRISGSDIRRDGFWKKACGFIACGGAIVFGSFRGFGGNGYPRDVCAIVTLRDQFF